ncbi:hypothetical protein BG000_010823 [Podila horticola]|nr:hypothetical protein BG000_010823 [Podila horticola]
MTGIDISPKMVAQAKHYKKVYLGEMQNIIPFVGNFDHVVSFGALNFLQKEEFVSMMDRCFAQSRYSITVGIDGVSDEFNKRMTEIGKDHMRTYDHTPIIDSYSIPEGWRLVHKQREFFWKSPSTGDEVYGTNYRFEAIETSACIHRLNYGQPLVDDDVANIMPKHIQTVHSYNLVSQEWDCQLASCESRSNNKRPSLLWAVLKAGGWSWLPILVFALFESIMEHVQLLLEVLLNLISSYSTDDPSPPEYGVILSIGISAGLNIDGQYFQMGTDLVLEFKAGLVSMIYRKSLKLSPNARRETTVGGISNHTSVDAEMISQTVSFIPGIISAPFKICVGMWLLYRQLGPSAFTGLGLVLLIIPIQGLIARKLNMAKDKKLKAMDNRIRLLNEILSSIKIECSVREKLDAIRMKELKHLRHIGITVILMEIIYTSLPLLMTLLSLTVYSLVGGPGAARGTMSAQVVFVSITLFGRLAKLIGRMSQIEQLDDAQIEYFDSPQGSSVGGFIRVKSATHMALSQPGSKVVSTSVHNATFSWDRATGEPEKWKPCDLDGKSGSRKVIIAGHHHWRYVQAQGESYVPQQAWIFNASLKENILFGKALDQERYDHIIAAAGLIPDFKMLPAGDLTEIGERGIKISGGQKQRVSLARAAYQDADIYLLDDPLSAVDAHVDQHLWQNLIGPKGLLKDKHDFW